MDFSQLTPEQRTVCARLLGAFMGSVRSLPRDEFGPGSQLAMEHAYRRVYGIIDELWDALDASYPPD